MHVLIGSSLPRFQIGFCSYLLVDAKKTVNPNFFGSEREREAQRDIFHCEILVMSANLLSETKARSSENRFSNGKYLKINEKTKALGTHHTE